MTRNQLNQRKHYGQSRGLASALTMALLFIFTAIASAQTAAPRQGNSDSAGTAQKLKALEAACSSGVLTPEECAAKGAALTRNSTAKAPANSAQLQALQRACDAGVFTPAECQAKRAALTGSAASGAATVPSGGPDANPKVWQSNDPNATPPQSDGQVAGGHSDSSHSDNSGSDSGPSTLYRDSQGAFTIMIPPGWTAKTIRGCYGPQENCPRNATGVNIQSEGRSWAFVAPFSGDARRPTDVVEAAGEEIRSDLRNFKESQNDPDKLNGLDIAIGQFTGVNRDGESVSIVVMGIAAPDGKFFVAQSFLPQNETQSAGPALSSMAGTLRFGGR